MPPKYVDNAMNQRLGRVGLPHGTAVHHGGSYTDYGGSSMSSGSHKTYVDNSMKLGRVGLEHGTAVHSKSSPRSNMASFEDPFLGFMTPCSQSSRDSRSSMSSGSHKTYVDNAPNRRLGRVGLEHGTAVHSKASSQNLSGVSSLHKSVGDQQVKKSLSTLNNGTSNSTPEKKVYVDNAYNRKHNRVGLPLGSAPVSKKNEVYKDTPLNKELGRVGKPWGTHAVGKKKLASLSKHLEEHFDEEIPAELNDVSEDTVDYILEFNQRLNEIKQLLEEGTNIFWKPQNQNVQQEHTNSAEPPCNQEDFNSISHPYDHTFPKESSNSTGQALKEIVKKNECKEIDFDKLQMGVRIGRGGFGEVFIATLDNLVVAVKKLKYQQISKRRLQQFTNEMAVLQKLDHPNIISFYGVCIVIPNLAIVMEYMDMSLFDSIQIKGVDFTDVDKLEIMLGVTKGMAYLHHQNIAHCDLKTKNVLLDNVPGSPQTDESQPVITKITDFGLSKMKSDTVTTTSSPSVNIGTPIYAAPEKLRGEILTLDQLKKADMYSLGLLIWELAFEEIPFEDFDYEQLKVQVGMKGLKPVMPDDLRLDRNLHESLNLCWSMEPDKRPSARCMAKVASTLTTLLEKGEE